MMTVDLRNMDDALLRAAEQRLAGFVDDIAAREGVDISQRQLARFKPVDFDGSMIALVEETAHALGFSCKRMPSGAGHDAQMFAANCPTAMIFVPSKDGVSHNVAEYTSPEELEAGANLLLQAMLSQAGE